nr:mytiporin 22 [Mytilus galloprovincialis]
MGTSASSNIQHGEDIDSVIQTLNYTIVCGIEIKNSTKHTLHSPRTIVQWGFLLSPPSTAIKPGGKGHFIGHKHSAGVTGTTGVVSYLIGETDWRMVIMWSAPYNFDFFDNRLAVGFIKSRDDSNIYNRMYYENDDKFSRDNYCRSCNIIKDERDGFVIQGIMGTSHKSKVEVELSEKV